MLCFKVYGQLTIGEDTPETSLFLQIGIKYDEILNKFNSRFGRQSSIFIFDSGCVRNSK